MTAIVDLQDELIAFIAAEVAAYDDPIDSGTDLLLTGQVDSLGVVLIVDWLEQRLQIEIDPGDVVLEHFQTVALMVAYLTARGAL